MASKIKDREILVGIGVGNIEFGMTRDEIAELLGNPTEVEVEILEDDETEERLEVWHYDDEGFSFAFDSSVDFQLASISSNNPDIHLNNFKMLGLEYEELSKFLDENDITDYEEVGWEPQGDDNFTIFSDQTGITFWFEGGVLTEIEWSVLYPDDDFIMWASEEE